VLPRISVDSSMVGFGSGSTLFPTTAGLPLGETAYTALARMAASAGDGAAALAAAQGMVAAGVAPRLRSFTPALLAFSTAGQVQALPENHK